MTVDRSVTDEAIPAATVRFGTAVGWSFAMNTAQTLSTLLTAFVLAGLLGPEAYGTVALALIFVSMLQLLSEQGMAPAVIQRRDLTRRHLDTAFWLTLTMSLVLFGVCWALSGWYAGLNNAPEAQSVIRVLSVLVVARGLTVIQEALLERQLDYRVLAVRTAIASLLGAVAGIGYALVTLSLWAFVVQQVVTSVVSVAVLWSITTWRPRFRFSFDDARDLLSFAGRMLLSSVAVFVNTRVDALLVGLYFGATAIGLYRLADRLVQAAIMLSTRPVQRVGLPEFARHQHDRAQTRDRYLSLSSAASAVGASVMAIVFACAQPLMDVLGAEWSDAALVLQMLCAVGLVRVISMVNGPAVVGVGYPGAQATMMWISAALSAGAFVLAGMLLSGRELGVQVVGMAASRAVLFVVVLLPVSQVWLVRRYVGVRPAEFARAVSPSSVLALLAGLGGAALGSLLAGLGWPSAVVLVVVGAFTAMVIFPLNLMTSPASRQIATRLVRRHRDDRSARAAGASDG